MFIFAAQKWYSHGGYAKLKSSLTYEEQKYKENRSCSGRRQERRYCVI